MQEPERGIARVLYRLRTQGPQWIIRRVSSEWTLPTTLPGRLIHRVCRLLLGSGYALFRARTRWKIERSDTAATLFAFYDLKVEPVTFDVTFFLVAADLERRRQGLKDIHVVFVPGPGNGLRTEMADYELVVDFEARRWRLHNILIDAVSFLSACSGFSVLGSRAEAEAVVAIAAQRKYPLGYEPHLPGAFHPRDFLVPARKKVRPIGVLHATSQGLRYVDQWIAGHAKGRRLLAVTLRDYEFGAARNSDLSAWGDFVRQLDRRVWCPVFILDTERACDRIPEALQLFEVMLAASWNLHLRMALYERAWLNLGVNNGPMSLCWMNDQSRYITFKMATPSVAQSTVAFQLSRGFEPGQSLPFATPFQKFVWEDDSFDVINKEFLRMVKQIEDMSGTRDTV